MQSDSPTSTIDELHEQLKDAVVALSNADATAQEAAALLARAKHTVLSFRRQMGMSVNDTDSAPARNSDGKMALLKLEDDVDDLNAKFAKAHRRLCYAQDDVRDLRMQIRQASLAEATGVQGPPSVDTNAADEHDEILESLFSGDGLGLVELIKLVVNGLVADRLANQSHGAINFGASTTFNIGFDPRDRSAARGAHREAVQDEASDAG